MVEGDNEAVFVYAVWAKKRYCSRFVKDLVLSGS